MIASSTSYRCFLYIQNINLPDFKPNAFTFTDQFKIYRRKERKERKKILVYVEEYLQEVPFDSEKKDDKSFTRAREKSTPSSSSRRL